MIIYISMILWVLLMRLLCTGGMQYGQLYNGARYYKVGKGVAFITMAYIVFWVGMRSGFVDTRAYINAFEHSSSDVSQVWPMLTSNTKGQAWHAMVIVFKAFISKDYHVWFMFLACLMGFSVSSCYCRYSEAFFFSMLIFILSANFTWLMNGLRQCLCATTLLLATPWLLQGKTVRYLALIAVLSFVHITVWLMVPIYFVVRQRPWGKMTLLAIVGTALACYLAVPLAGEVEEAMEATSYAGSTLFKEGDDGVHPLRVLVAAAPAMLGWVMRRRIAEENNAMLNIGINLSLIAALQFAFGVFTSGILMGRLPFYCAVYAPITLTLLINRLSAPALRKLLTVFCLFAYAAFFYLVYSKGMYYISDLTGFIPPSL